MGHWAGQPDSLLIGPSISPPAALRAEALSATGARPGHPGKPACRRGAEGLELRHHLCSDVPIARHLASSISRRSSCRRARWSVSTTGSSRPRSPSSQRLTAETEERLLVFLTTLTRALRTGMV